MASMLSGIQCTHANTHTHTRAREKIWCARYTRTTGRTTQNPSFFNHKFIPHHNFSYLAEMNGCYERYSRNFNQNEKNKQQRQFSRENTFVVVCFCCSFWSRANLPHTFHWDGRRCNTFPKQNVALLQVVVRKDDPKICGFDDRFQPRYFRTKINVSHLIGKPKLDGIG